MTDSDEAQLAVWWAAAKGQPQVLPEGLTHVQSRLVRTVGRGMLPEAGEVFAKLMWFPRRKDRLRYLLRPLPAEHEAAMLRWCAGAGIRVPEVVFVGAHRVARLPRASMLVTAGLAVTAEAPAPAAICRIVRQLLEAGVFHPDLHLDNFLPCADGEVAVIDLQSARRRPGGVSGAERSRMLGRLLEPPDPWRLLTAPPAEDRGIAAELERSGLCDAAEVSGLRADLLRAARRALVGRVERCLRESTEFSVRHGLRGVTYSRRAALPATDSFVEGGPEMVRYWIGDRCREILESTPPLLAALYRSRLWSRRCRIQLGNSAASFAAARDDLRHAHDRYRRLVEEPG